MNEYAIKLIEKAAEEKATFLDLGNCGLTEIPPEIEILVPHIQHLNFGSWYRFLNNIEERSINPFTTNNFESNFSSLIRLSELPYLRTLEFSFCGLGDKGTENLNKLIHLTSLNLGWNNLDFKGINNIKNLKELVSLEVGWNKIGDKGIENINEFQNLSFLSIHSNKIGDNGVESIKGLKNLTSLIIFGNDIGDIGAESIKELKKLTSLYISSNNIGYKGAKSIKELKKLISLDIGSNKIGEKGAECIKKLKNLTSLDISGNEIGDKGAESIKELQNLTLLGISFNKIGYKGVESIKELQNLTLLDISRNEIGDKGCESIKELQNLTSLDISDNNIGKKGAETFREFQNLTSLNIRENKIGDKGVESIKELKSLTSLDISDNNIGEKGAECIKKLQNLTSLNISWNNIGDNGADSIKELQNLTLLYIWDNEIGDIGAKSICSLRKLESLYISMNDISNTNPFKSLKNLRKISLDVNPIKDVPSFIIEEDNCIDDLKIWWKETGDKTKVKENEIVKLQLIGNGNSGKSSIIEALKNGICKEEYKSTHGVIVEPLSYSINGEEVKFQVWDFGGQEIYYGTHKLFIASQAIQIIVVDAESEKLALEHTKVEDRDSGEAVLYQPLQHYINMSKKQSPDSLRIIVLNKIDISDKDGELSKIAERIKAIADKNKIPFIKLSATNGENVESLQDLLSKSRSDILYYKMPMPISWLNVRQYFMDNLEEEEIDRRKMITRNKFDRICKQNNVWEKAVPTLLEFLHHTGIVYKNDKYFKDTIIIDQKWAMDAIYKPLDRKSDFYDDLRNDFKGRVPIKHLFRAFGSSYVDKQKWLFLHFMQSCGLCFPINAKEVEETENSYYIFPEFLPENETPTVKDLWASTTDYNTYIFKPEYLDYFTIQKFIIDLGHKTKIENIWKYGILLITEKGKFKVVYNIAESSITVFIESSIEEEFLEMIINTLDPNKKDNERNHWFTKEGEQLNIQSVKERKPIERKTSKDISQIEGDKPKENDLISKLPDKEQVNPKRLVVSFASEDLRDLKDLKKHLAGFEDDGIIQVQYDKLVISGRENWDDEIQEMFQNADGYILLISPDYQNISEKEYVWTKEMPIIDKRFTEKNIFTWCIPVSYVNVNRKLSKFASFKGGKKPLPKRGQARDKYFVEFVNQVIEGKFLTEESV